MDLAALSDFYYQSLFYQGIAFTSLGFALRGLGAPEDGDGITRSTGLNTYICKIFPGYAKYAPAVAHFLISYGVTLAFGSPYYNGPPVQLENENLRMMSPYISGAAVMWFNGIWEIIHDIRHHKTTISDMLQWGADFLGPTLALAVAGNVIY